MGKRVKILIVGLPLFAEKLQKELAEFSPENKFYFLDTYYNKWDRLKALFLIPRIDVIYSINGTLSKSRVVDLALKFNKKIIFEWVGTDVVKAMKLTNKNVRYVKEVKHYCEVDWIKDELNSIGVNAEILNFVSFNKRFELTMPAENKLKVLSYIPDNRAEFYGINQFLELAKSFPKVDFTIAGGEAKMYRPLPENVRALGWVDNMGTLFNESHVCVRFPEHDGLSSFILESLARGKQVMYKYGFNHCHEVTSLDSMKDVLNKLERKFNAGENISNHEGKAFIENNFSSEKILGDLLKALTS